MFMQYFNFNEFFTSDAAEACGIKNYPSSDSVCYVRSNILLLVFHVLEPIREYVGMPVRVISGYRCARLNELVGGCEHSQHSTGEAVDFQVDSFRLNDYKMLAYWCADNLDFDQLIVHVKRKYIHISYASPGNNRHEVLFAQ